MTGSPPHGSAHRRRRPALMSAKPFTQTILEPTTQPSPPPTSCAKRRRRQGPPAATRSGYARAWTPTPQPGAPTNNRRRPKTRPRQPLTSPAPSGMTCIEARVWRSAASVGSSWARSGAVQRRSAQPCAPHLLPVGRRRIRGEPAQTSRSVRAVNCAGRFRKPNLSCYCATRWRFSPPSLLPGSKRIGRVWTRIKLTCCVRPH